MQAVLVGDIPSHTTGKAPRGETKRNCFGRGDVAVVAIPDDHDAQGALGVFGCDGPDGGAALAGGGFHPRLDLHPQFAEVCPREERIVGGARRELPNNKLESGKKRSLRRPRRSAVRADVDAAARVIRLKIETKRTGSARINTGAVSRTLWAFKSS